MESQYLHVQMACTHVRSCVKVTKPLFCVIGIYRPFFSYIMSTTFIGRGIPDLYNKQTDAMHTFPYESEKHVRRQQDNENL